jgi:hyperosmotically inducible protein
MGWASDAWITGKSKVALLTADDVSATDVNVDTIDGRVTLHGKVPSQAAKNAATTAVRGIDGVREVTNLLQVVQPTAEKRVSVEDSTIEDNVEKALSAESSLADSDISVQSVHNGVVLLAGEATIGDQVEAIQTASAVSGVARVASEMSDSSGKTAGRGSAPAKSDRTAAKTSGDDQAAAGDSSTLGDAWLTTKVKTRLLADGEAPALDVNVDTNDGVVTLFGEVDSQAAKAAAEREAQKVDGVKSVRNMLQVVPKAQHERVARADTEIENGVERELGERKQFRQADIDVAVHDGVVRLTGTAPSSDIRLSAATVARSVGGVRSVQNDIAVESDRG